MATQLSFTKVSKLNKPGRYFDGGSRLHLLIKKSGKKYWIYRYTREGKRHDKSLGVFPEVTLAQARIAAYEARTSLDRGNCLVAEKPKTRRMNPKKGEHLVQFREFALDYVALKQSEWKNKKHAEQWLNTLRDYAFPVIGAKTLDLIDTDDLVRILEPIWTSRTETASRLRGRIERILAAATTRKLRTGVNPALWRGHLDTLLPQPRKVSKVVHHPALDYKEVPSFIEKLQGRESMAALALEFIILTAARTSEVTGAIRSEIVDGIWTIPADRMKAGRQHRVPLCQRATAILEKARTLDPGSQHLFSIAGRPLSNMAMLQLLKRMNYTFTVHGFRSSFRDWAAEKGIYPNEVCEMALAHTIGNKAEAAYRRGDLLEVRRRLMLDWEDYCINSLHKVVALKAA